MWSQGYDAIAADDPPLLFNEVLKDREGVLGASVLYQIICYGHPELETYYCGMCNHWTTVSVNIPCLIDQSSTHLGNVQPFDGVNAPH